MGERREGDLDLRRAEVTPPPRRGVPHAVCPGPRECCRQGGNLENAVTVVARHTDPRRAAAHVLSAVGGGLGVTAPEDRRERGPQSQQSASAKPCLGRESLPAVSQTHGHGRPAAGPVHTCLPGAPAATEIHDPHRNGLQTPPGQALEPIHILTLGKRKPTRGVVSTHRGRVWEPNAVTQCVLHV